MSYSCCHKFAPYSHLLIRFCLAAIFLYHGLGKVPMADMMAQKLDLPVNLIYASAASEILGGFLILWGGCGPDLATRLAGLVFAFNMIGAIWLVHWENGWSFMSGWGEGTNGMGGMEFQTLILAVSLHLIFTGNQGCDSSCKQ